MGAVAGCWTAGLVTQNAPSWQPRAPCGLCALGASARPCGLSRCARTTESRHRRAWRGHSSRAISEKQRGGAGDPRGVGGGREEAGRPRPAPGSLSLPRASLARAQRGRTGVRRAAGRGGGAPAGGGSLGPGSLAGGEWGRRDSVGAGKGWGVGSASGRGLGVRPEWGARRCPRSVRQGALRRAQGGGGVQGEGEGAVARRARFPRY